MNKRARLLAVTALGLALSASANAALIDRGNGMIYDSDQDITWLQDANYAMTSGYDADGLMNWDNAMSWADTLVFGGYDDWRLASVTDDNNNGCPLRRCRRYRGARTRHTVVAGCGPGRCGGYQEAALLIVCADRDVGD